MLRVTLAEVRAHPTRLLGIILAVTLSVGFVVAGQVFVDTEIAGLRRAVSAQTAGSSVVVQPSTDRDLTPAIAETQGVDHVEASPRAWLEVSAGGRNSFLEITAQPTDPQLQWMTLQSGSWPTTADEIALGRQTADRTKVGVGDTIAVRDPSGTDEAPRQLRVTGVVDESASLFAGLQSTGVVAASSPALTNGAIEYLVIARTGVDPSTLVSALHTRLPADTDVITATDLAQQRLDMLTGGLDVVRYLLLTFGSIAALVGAMIIANIFSIVVAQRRRQIALLRAVGATRSQVRGQLLIEAAALASEAGISWTQVYTLPGLADLAVRGGQPELAVRLYAAGAALAAGTGLAVSYPPDVERGAHGIALARAQLDPPTFERLWDSGRGLDLDQVAALAESLRGERFPPSQQNQAD